MALIHQSGGGTGFSFSRLRSKGSMVRSTTGVASGPVSFMKLYDASTDAVKQGGTRRGANMGILRVDHPDILDFIACKEDLTQIVELQYLRRRHRRVHEGARGRRRLRSRRSRQQEDHGPAPRQGRMGQDAPRRLAHGRARRVLHRRSQPLQSRPHLGAYEATNPCGEQPLLPYDVCNLGSINVGYYVNDGEIDWDSFATDIHLSTHFLDNIIDVNKYPLPEIDALAKRIRRIGLGVMGFADALVRLGIPYDSAEGVEFGRKVMAVPRRRGQEGERAPRRERGAFPEWAQSIWGPDATCARDAAGARIRPMQMLRNCNVTTVAPTGTISIIAGCSSRARAALRRCVHAESGRRA